MSVELLEKAIGENHKTTIGKIDELSEKSVEAHKRLVELEQKLAVERGFQVSGQGDSGSAAADITAALVANPAYELMGKGLAKEVGVQLPPGLLTKAILNATGASQPLVAAHRMQTIVDPAQRRFTVRDLLPVARTESNLIEYPKLNVYTNAAAPQFSSPSTYEGVTKPESNMTFTLASAPVVTLAHWIAASRQVLSDASMLRSYIENQLLYGLKFVQEDNLLNGDGTGGTLNGLMNNATAYAGSGAVSADTKLDTIARAIGQLNSSQHEPDGVVMHPNDWWKIRLTKDTAGRYVFGDPADQTGPQYLWGIRVVPTTAIAETRFLVGHFEVAAQIWDREQNTIRIAEQHENFFTRNLVAILAELRVALTVFRSAALIRGNFVS